MLIFPRALFISTLNMFLCFLYFITHLLAKETGIFGGSEMLTLMLIFSFISINCASQPNHLNAYCAH